MNLPEGAVVLWDSLCENPTLEQLHDDLVAIKLPDWKFIDVSWVPAWDANGRYCVTVFEREWENQLATFESKDLKKVVEKVEELARMFV